MNVVIVSTASIMGKAKIGECVWCLAVLADRTEMNFSDCVEEFLKERLFSLDGSFRIIGKAKMQIWY